MFICHVTIVFSCCWIIWPFRRNTHNCDFLICIFVLSPKIWKTQQNKSSRINKTFLFQPCKLMQLWKPQLCNKLHISLKHAVKSEVRSETNRKRKNMSLPLSIRVEPPDVSWRLTTPSLNSESAAEKQEIQITVRTTLKYPLREETGGC